MMKSPEGVKNGAKKAKTVTFSTDVDVAAPANLVKTKPVAAPRVQVPAVAGGTGISLMMSGAEEIMNMIQPRQKKQLRFVSSSESD